MAQNPKTQNNQASNPKQADHTVEVLYQKMGDRWFAFSLIDEEVFVGSISQEEIDRLEAQNKKATHAKAGNA